MWSRVLSQALTRVWLFERIPLFPIACCSKSNSYVQVEPLHVVLSNGRVSRRCLFTSSANMVKRRPPPPVQEEEESDLSDEEDEAEVDDGVPKDFKLIKIHVNSARVDSVLQKSIGMSRSKIEEAFYAGKIMHNGEKLSKKAKELSMGDTADYVYHSSPENPDFSVVDRIQYSKLVGGDNKNKIVLEVKKWSKMTVDYKLEE